MKHAARLERLWRMSRNMLLDELELAIDELPEEQRAALREETDYWQRLSAIGLVLGAAPGDI